MSVFLDMLSLINLNLKWKMLVAIFCCLPLWFPLWSEQQISSPVHQAAAVAVVNHAPLLYSSLSERLNLHHSPSNAVIKYFMQGLARRFLLHAKPHWAMQPWSRAAFLNLNTARFTVVCDMFKSSSGAAERGPSISELRLVVQLLY